jgi:hypothetical protein
VLTHLASTLCPHGNEASISSLLPRSSPRTRSLRKCGLVEAGHATFAEWKDLIGRHAGLFKYGSKKTGLVHDQGSRAPWRDTPGATWQLVAAMLRNQRNRLGRNRRPAPLSNGLSCCERVSGSAGTTAAKQAARAGANLLFADHATGYRDVAPEIAVSGPRGCLLAGWTSPCPSGRPHVRSCSGALPW